MARGLRSWQMARIAGFPQPQMFSTRLHARRVKATATTVERLQKVADLVGFPRNEIFLHDEPERESSLMGCLLAPEPEVRS
jgi:hypothetical protein